MVVFMWTAVEGQKQRLYYFIFESLRSSPAKNIQLDEGKDNIERFAESGEICKFCNRHNAVEIPVRADTQLQR